MHFALQLTLSLQQFLALPLPLLGQSLTALPPVISLGMRMRGLVVVFVLLLRPMQRLPLQILLSFDQLRPLLQPLLSFLIESCSHFLDILLHFSSQRLELVQGGLPVIGWGPRGRLIVRPPHLLEFIVQALNLSVGAFTLLRQLLLQLGALLASLIGVRVEHHGLLRMPQLVAFLLPEGLVALRFFLRLLQRIAKSLHFIQGRLFLIFESLQKSLQSHKLLSDLLKFLQLLLAAAELLVQVFAFLRPSRALVRKPLFEFLSKVLTISIAFQSGFQLLLRL